MHNSPALHMNAQAMIRRNAVCGNQGNSIVIGLVNLAPLTAMRIVEKQFRSLLKASNQRFEVELRVFSLLGQSPSRSMKFSSSTNYKGLDALYQSRLDGLIVTGMEPSAAGMDKEPCWPAIKKLVDWASENTISAIWSCFAAHAAVFRLDAICRQPVPEKILGVFECHKAAEHAILRGPVSWLVPHSRNNTLSEDELRENNYQILSQASDIGVDSFTKSSGDSQFLFFQGHPEYDVDILCSEYFRDIKRFVTGIKLIYPKLPENYFNQATNSAFTILQNKVHRISSKEFIAELHRIPLQTFSQNWRQPARDIYAGWLAYIEVQKLQRHRLSL